MNTQAEILNELVAIRRLAERQLAVAQQLHEYGVQRLAFVEQAMEKMERDGNEEGARVGCMALPIVRG